MLLQVMIVLGKFNILKIKKILWQDRDINHVFVRKIFNQTEVIRLIEGLVLLSIKLSALKSK
jgi:hypothetical protein